jgi:hypothetical protein
LALGEAELAAVSEPVVFVSGRAVVREANAAIVEGIVTVADRAAGSGVSHALIEIGVVVIAGLAADLRRRGRVLNAGIAFGIPVSAVRAFVGVVFHAIAESRIVVVAGGAGVGRLFFFDIDVELAGVLHAEGVRQLDRESREAFTGEAAFDGVVMVFFAVKNLQAFGKVFLIIHFATIGVAFALGRDLDSLLVGLADHGIGEERLVGEGGVVEGGVLGAGEAELFGGLVGPFIAGGA